MTSKLKKKGRKNATNTPVESPLGIGDGKQVKVEVGKSEGGTRGKKEHRDTNDLPTFQREKRFRKSRDDAILVEAYWE